MRLPGHFAAVCLGIMLVGQGCAPVMLDTAGTSGFGGTGGVGGCSDATDCAGAEDTCQHRTCIAGVCGMDFTASGIAIPTQTAGDCKVTVCDGNGGTKDNTDDADVPDDLNACTSDTCAMGTPSNTNLAQGTDCTPMGSMLPLVCNAVGQCVGCNVAADCGATDECKTYTCTNKVCGVAFAPANTQVAAQTNNDCLVHVCNGNGQLIDIADDNDVPLDDGNVCTNQTCAGGMPMHPNAVDGAVCSDGNACTQSDACQMGVCAGANPVICMALDGCQVAGACNAITGMCDNQNVPNGTICQVGGASGTCTMGVCTKNTGEPCTMAGECVTGICADAFCCNTACLDVCKSCGLAGTQGTCTNVALNQDDVGTCSGATQSCDGAGICKSENGQICAMASQCFSNNCVDGVCCNSACTATCQSCNVAGSVGACSNIPVGQDDTNATMTCSGANQSCNGAGSCKSENGQTCAMASQCLSNNCVDGVCCNSACTATCQSCNVAGSVGACSNIPAGQDDTNATMTCSGANQSCNGAGSCKSENGQTCAVASQCLSNNCVDSVCCNGTCTGTCYSCSVTGSLGTCSVVPFGQDDAVTCSGANQSCNGAGACKKEIGQACGIDGECLSSSCNGSACSGASCKALSVNCGPGQNESCCVSSVVTGGTYNRSNDPMYPATVNDFRLDRFEITVGRFRKFVEAYPGNKPLSGAGAHPLIAGSGWNTAWDANLPTDQAALKTAVKCSATLQTWTDAAGANEKLPMNCIDWYTSFAFCAWDGGRLPTEAEWNYAAAGGSEQRQYPWSIPPTSTMIDGSYAVYDCLGDGSAAGVCALTDILTSGSKSPKGDGRWGQADLGGSMWEWNLDWQQSPYSPQCNNCANILSGTRRVIRGGYWGNVASYLLSSSRGDNDPTLDNNGFGARCARTP